MKHHIKIGILLLITMMLVLVGCTAEDPGHVIINNENPLDVSVAGNPEVKIVDDSSNIITIDPTTRVINAIEFEHNEIHAGDSFLTCDVLNVNVATAKWQVTTPDSLSYAHVIFDLEATGEMLVLITEGSDRVDGTALNEINRRRVLTPKVANIIVTRTPTGGSTDGATSIFCRRSGATGQANKTISGGGARGLNEFVLRPNTKYVIAITTFANIYVTFSVSWYEHIDEVP